MPLNLDPLIEKWLSPFHKMKIIIKLRLWIPVKELKKIFTKILKSFARVENDPHLLQEGTGLGLSIVQSLNQLHNGILKINSQVNVGSTVAITTTSA